MQAAAAAAGSTRGVVDVPASVGCVCARARACAREPMPVVGARVVTLESCGALRVAGNLLWVCRELWELGPGSEADWDTKQVDGVYLDLLKTQELRSSLIHRQQLENRPPKETISDPLLL